MFQAIVTKYIGPTNTKGSRVKASCAGGSLIVHWDYALNPSQNHQRAADLLAEKLGWVGENHGELIGGGMPANNGFCFVFANTEHENWRMHLERAQAG